jgi:non-ribosomal peptide synthetase component F
LTSGISQVVADDAQRKDPLKLSELIDAQGVTVWDTVPSAWGHGMDRLQAVRNRSDTDFSLQSIRLIMLTGEALHWKLPRQWWRDFNPATKVINLYSQTETAGSVAYYPLTKDDPKANDGDMVPLGSVFSDVEIRLLEEDVMLAATPGSKGEICVFGNRLAAGYLNKALHEEKFLSIQSNGNELRPLL